MDTAHYLAVDYRMRKYPLPPGQHEYTGWHGRTSVRAGTISGRARMPQTVWVTVCWLLATAGDTTGPVLTAGLPPGWLAKMPPGACG